MSLLEEHVCMCVCVCVSGCLGVLCMIVPEQDMALFVMSVLYKSSYKAVVTSLIVWCY